MGIKDINQFDYLMETPYAKRGRDPNTGLDCFGLVWHVYQALGTPIPAYEYPDVSSEWGRTIDANYHELWEKVERPEAGDVVRMYWLDPVANHVGVYLGETAGTGWVIHMTLNGAVKQKFGDIKKRVAGIYRLK